MTLSSLLSYFQILLKVKIMRTVYHTNQFIGQTTGKVLVSSTPPFETIFIDSTKSRRRIKVNVYRTAAALKPDAGPIAVHLNWHGSGFVLTNFGENKPFIEHVLKHEALASYPLAIFDCDHAKAPEYPCPAATDDAQDVLDYVLKHPSIYDPNRITLGGFSAGGCVALGVAAHVGSQVRNSTWPHSLPPSGHPIQANVVFYPPISWGQNRFAPPIPKGATFPGFLPEKDLTDVFDAAYFFPHTFDLSSSSQEDLQRVQALQRQPLLCPLEADPRDYPNTVALITAEYDTLTYEDEQLREKLKKVPGKQVYGWTAPKVGHAWDIAVIRGQYGYEERIRAYDLAAKIIARAGGIHVDV